MEHEVLVVKLGKPEKHPNADRLEIFDINGRKIISEIGRWQEGSLAALVEDNYVLPDTEEYRAIMGDNLRVKPRKIRDIFSFGVLVNPPAGAKEGDNVMDILGIIRYISPEQKKEIRIANREKAFKEKHGNIDPCLEGIHKYNIEHLYKYWKYVIGERLHVTEKLNGENIRFVFRNNNMYLGSHENWKSTDCDDWWICVDDNPWIVDLCKEYPDHVFYGERFGYNKHFPYSGLENDLRIFDVYDANKEVFWDTTELIEKIPVCRRVPFLGEAYINTKEDVEKLLEYSDEPSMLGEHGKEGIVVRTYKEKCLFCEKGWKHQKHVRGVLKLVFK